MTMLRVGEPIELTVEKPAAGGRMIARHEGQVVLVGGAVPGERVIALVERLERRLAFATVAEVSEASPDRRASFADPLCGGCVYSHIAYPRQLALKADIVRDAFLRLGRMPLDTPIDVAASPERGYRMRARLHVDGGRVGFYREGTHLLCDAALTGQLSEAAITSIEAAVAVLARDGAQPASAELTENIAGDQRSLSIELRQGRRVTVGDPSVSDPLDVVTRGRVSAGEVRRHPESFFQGNRFLLPDLVHAVLDAVGRAGDVLDLYSGVGLFAIALAATGVTSVTAVEGDRASGADLQRNATPFGAEVTVVLESVEGYLAARRRRGPASVKTIVLDPPRTGVSNEAMAGLLNVGAPRLVYVSCDPATMARDARRLLDAGYRMEALRAFDLFPNTAHIETLAVFSR
jgi:23S rRNA (uracil1939-C5)-methyltransferase